MEASEDDPVVGASELKRIADAYDQVLFIGITCGLSAPFVGGQLEYCLENPNKFTPVLMGFNPVSMARRMQVPKWPNGRTFWDIASRMESTPNALVLNPIVGPEPISGSSRMKGGTATKVMLDTACFLASADPSKKSVDVINEFRATVANMEAEKKDLAAIVTIAGEW